MRKAAEEPPPASVSETVRGMLWRPSDPAGPAGKMKGRPRSDLYGAEEPSLQLCEGVAPSGRCTSVRF